MDIKEMKIVKHFSHNHPLSPSKLQEIKEEEELICSICEVSLSSSSLGCASSDQNHYYYYKCTKPNCDFLLHKSCFELPEQIHDHKSHPSHTLTLHFPSSSSSSSSSNDDDYHLFFCEACGLHGSAFRYQCKSCQFDVHVGCASLPQMVECKNHQHPLTLLYGYPNDKEDGTGAIPVSSGGAEAGLKTDRFEAISNTAK
ncbi:Cysteine/Histidine-rich C1 domain family protein [Senna tora]|uniref:Cysteine/Histidine-rich C1 domain family protein n=1 Tax=Senna tora TaxID=362788 RepID=A0A834TUP8_9FABA|nr:Cysteine/Histidine-rich C1 domain family protein [Senna tora]